MSLGVDLTLQLVPLRCNNSRAAFGLYAFIADINSSELFSSAIQA